jgi:hypothetical protein
MRINLTRWIVLAVLGLVVGAGHAQADLTIVLRSGNGTIGGTDTLVNMLVGPANSSFASTFTSADFTAARIGADAFIIARNSAWIPTLSGDASSQWISTSASGASEGSTALYAISFTLTEAFSSAALDLHYASDNFLGGAPNQGVYINGTAISGNSSGGNFGSEFSLSRSDIAPLLTLGTNTLYINSTDVGGPSGLLFRATITTTGVATAAPEPSTMASAATGVLILASYAAKRRRRRAVA